MTSECSAEATTRIQVSLLVRRADAPERTVAMREAAEAGDDVVVGVRVPRVAGIERRDQGDRAFLVGQGFGVLERHVEEDPQIRIDLVVESGLERARRVMP